MDEVEHSPRSETAEPAPAPAAPSLDAGAVEALRNDVVAALKTVYDPEIPVNIYDLGLVYGVEVEATGDVRIEMTLTAPGCPVAASMPDMVRQAIEPVPGVGAIDVEIVWDPPWDPSRMSDEAKLELGWL
ncbi:MAG: SUF system Fe-S cluster assembly protein [Rhodospirillaceae bacterium]|nr:SUF system Fe-S cluster assembly protein [Rhodospirillaceae bacterium]